MNFIKYPHLAEGNKNPDCHVLGTLFAGGKKLAKKGPCNEWIFPLKKNIEDCFICSKPPDDKWCVLLDCGHQNHKKCFNKWTGHSRVLKLTLKHTQCAELNMALMI